MKNPHLGNLDKDDKDYWKYKEIYMKLPSDDRIAINLTHIKAGSYKSWSARVKKYLKSLPKLEQLIYTNEIQGE